MHTRTAILVRRLILGHRPFSPRSRGLNFFPASLQQLTARHWMAQRHNNVRNPNLSPVQQCASSQCSTSRHSEQLSLWLSKTRVLGFDCSPDFLPKSNDSDGYDQDKFIPVAFAFDEEKSKFEVHGKCSKDRKHTTKPAK